MVVRSNGSVTAFADGARVARGAAAAGVVVAGVAGVALFHSTTVKPPSTTHPAAMPAVTHRLDSDAPAGCWRATSGSRQRGQRSRSPLTFAPHAAQMTAFATLSHLTPRQDAHADLADAVVVVVRIAEHFRLRPRGKEQMLVDDERRRRTRARHRLRLDRVLRADRAVTRRVIRGAASL